MNQVGEKISIGEASCREFNPSETLHVLKATNVWGFYSWGASKFLVDNMNAPKMLRMFVRGRKHTGHVYIFLNSCDLYDVYITTLSGKIKERTNEMGIYFDSLFEWIDVRIEKQLDYVF